MKIRSSSDMKRIILIFFLALLSAACTKHGGDNVGGSQLLIDASIQSGDPTRSVLYGNEFQTGNKIGLFVYHAENTTLLEKLTLYGNRYGNIAGRYLGDNLWQYNFEGASTTFTDIYLMMPSEVVYREDRALEICSYYPWTQGVTSITSVPFTLGGKSEDMADVMWAAQNATDENVVIPNRNTLPVTLTFNHALSLLKIGFRCAYDNKVSGTYIGTTMTVSSISIRRADREGATPLHTAGKLNALTGKVIYSDADAKEVLTYDYTDNNSYTFAFRPENDYLYVPMLICPEEYLGDGDYILEFTFNGQTLRTRYEIKRDDVRGGFLPGHVYTFKFTMDNTINFTGVQVEVDGPDKWTTESVNLIF